MAVRRVHEQLKLLEPLFVLIQIVAVSSVTPCADIDFPTADNFVLAGKENATVTIPFTMTKNSARCLGDGYLLQVMKLIPHSEHTVMCALPHPHGTCVQPKGKTSCVCPNTTGGDYHFHHTFDRTDNPPTLWKWSVDKGIGTTKEIIRERNMTFIVVYPPSVVNLTISPSQPVEPGRDVNVTCSYDEGRPRVEAYLLDRNDIILATSSYGIGQVRYRTVSVGCQDAGLIRCEAPGASNNESATLLVKCQPKIQLFNSTQNETRTTNLKFRVRAHTTEIQECTLNKSDTELNCSLTKLTGTPPDLVLTVRLDNVRKQDEGQWTLTLTNDAGQGQVDFHLNVTEVDVNLVIGAGTAVALFVSVNVTVCVLCVVKARKNVQLPAPAHELAVMRHQPARVREDVAAEEQASGQSVHEYFYVPDSPPPSDEDEFADDEPPPPVCHGPGNPPDDYLVPAPSRGEAQEEGTEWKTVRYYENTQLRPVGMKGTSHCATADNSQHTETGASVDVLGINAATADEDACAMDENIDTEEAEYVRYSPPLYENTNP